MVLSAQGPRPGRPKLDMVAIKLHFPSEWIEAIREKHGNVQPFVREAVREKLGV